MPSECRIVACTSWMCTGHFDDVVAVIVGFADADARLGAAAGHPHRKAARVVVAPVVGGRQFALAVDRPTELPTPNDQRILEQASLLEVLYQRRRGLVGCLALQGDVARKIVVLIPAAVVELDESHVALG